MNLVQYDCLDSYVWRCSNYLCNKRISIRSGTIFENSDLKFKSILSILNFYGVGITPKNCSKMLKIRVATILEWYQIFRQAISQMYEILKQEKIGGFGQIIEIDECQIGRRKYHRGRIPNEIWLFGRINRHEKNQVFIKKVQDRKKKKY